MSNSREFGKEFAQAASQGLTFGGIDSNRLWKYGDTHAALRAAVDGGNPDKIMHAYADALKAAGPIIADMRRDGLAADEAAGRLYEAAEDFSHHGRLQKNDAAKGRAV